MIASDVCHQLQEFLMGDGRQTDCLYGSMGLTDNGYLPVSATHYILSG
jgi:hypothetical protein